MLKWVKLGKLTKGYEILVKIYGDLGPSISSSLTRWSDYVFRIIFMTCSVKEILDEEVDDKLF